MIFCIAAAWAVARLRSPQARAQLVALTASEAPNLRALGAIGLGLLGDKGSVPILRRMAASGESGNLARAAAARALGLVGARGESETLAELARSPDTVLRASALVTLGCLEIPDAASAIADALVSPDAGLRAAAGSAIGIDRAAAAIAPVAVAAREVEGVAGPFGGDLERCASAEANLAAGQQDVHCSVGRRGAARVILGRKRFARQRAQTFVTLEDRGEHALKGVPDSWRLYAVVP